MNLHRVGNTNIGYIYLFGRKILVSITIDETGLYSSGNPGVMVLSRHMISYWTFQHTE